MFTFNRHIMGGHSYDVLIGGEEIGSVWRETHPYKNNKFVWRWTNHDGYWCESRTQAARNAHELFLTLTGWDAYTARVFAHKGAK